MFYIERKWKEIVINMKDNGVIEPRIWAERGGNEILDLNLQNFGINDTRGELRLIMLFK